MGLHGWLASLGLGWCHRRLIVGPDSQPETWKMKVNHEKEGNEERTSLKRENVHSKAQS